MFIILNLRTLQNFLKGFKILMKVFTAIYKTGNGIFADLKKWSTQIIDSINRNEIHFTF